MSRGLTLLEVLIAVAVTSIAVLAVAAMQSSALKANRQAAQVQAVTSLAAAELERQRQSVHVSSHAELERVCLSSLPDYLSCKVSSYPCRFDAATLTCTTTSVDPGELVAHQISVAVTATDASFQLQTVVRQ